MNTLNPSIRTIGIITAGILVIPLIAMQFTNEVAWTLIDFVIMGVLLFGTGVAYKMLVQKATNFTYQIGIATGLGTTFLMIWANLAVGLIGAGPHFGNMMYVGIVMIGIIGTVLSGLKAKRLKQTAFAMAIALGIVCTIALLMDMQSLPGSSVIEIIGVNGFFALLYLMSGAFFHSATQKEKASNQ